MSRRVLLRATAVIVAALVTGAVCVGITGPGPSGKATLVGYFADASPLDPGSQIRLAGVNVGTVDKVELQGGKARVTFGVDPSVLPLHDDSRLLIRPVNLLGESYVELQPGAPSRPFQSSGEIPVERTSSRVTLEDVLNTFDDPTSTALAVTLTSLGEGLQNAGKDTAAALAALAPAMTDTQRLATVLDGQNAVLNQLVDQAEPVARAVAADGGGVLDRTVGSTEQLLSTVAANSAAVSETLTELPATLATARQTLTGLAGTADATTPTLQAIRPITDDLNKVVSELHGFANAADPALAALKPVLDRANALLDQAGPAVAELRNAGPDLRGVAKDVHPLGDVVLDQHLDDLMTFVKYWSLSTNGRDGLGNYFRGVLWVTPDTLQDMLATPLLPAGATSGPPHQAPPALPLPGPSVSAPNAAGPTPDPGTATGLTEQQEQSLLGQLLGGA